MKKGEIGHFEKNEIGHFGKKLKLESGNPVSLKLAILKKVEIWNLATLVYKIWQPCFTKSGNPVLLKLAISIKVENGHFFKVEIGHFEKNEITHFEKN